MKKLLVLLPFIVFTSFLPENSSIISKKERKSLTKNFKETESFFLNNVKGLSDAQLDFKSSPERWSIRQCVEHITLSESMIFGFIENALKQPADPTKRADIKISDDDLLKALVDRSKKFTAPEVVQPKGKYKTLDEALTAFKEARQKHIDFVQTTQEDLRNHVFPHPAYGPLDTYQWLLLISAHSRRHTLQIEEVKSDPNFPKN